MKLKSLLPVAVSTCFAAVLLLTIGCGGESGGTEASKVDVSALEAKASKGDAEAAFKAGEFYAQNSDKPASMVSALKWFHIAAKLGNNQAALAITTLESTAGGDQIMDAIREAEQFKVAP